MPLRPADALPFLFHDGSPCSHKAPGLSLESLRTSSPWISVIPTVWKAASRQKASQLSPLQSTHVADFSSPAWSLASLALLQLETGEPTVKVWLPLRNQDKVILSNSPFLWKPPYCLTVQTYWLLNFPSRKKSQCPYRVLQEDTWDRVGQGGAEAEVVLVELSTSNQS